MSRDETRRPEWSVVGDRQFSRKGVAENACDNRHDDGHHSNSDLLPRGKPGCTLSLS